MESEWDLRDHRTPEELFGLAQIAVQVGSPRVDELLELAAAGSQDDPNILLGCYMTAMQSGREDSADVHQWFERAVQLSGDEGPIQTASLEEIVRRAPDWDRHVEDVWEKVRLGLAPLSVAAQLLHRPSLELQLSAMIANRLESDPRRRAVVPAFSGTRESPPLDAAVIGLDGSALVTLAMIDVLEIVMARRGGVHIPHSTLSWLFEERQQLGFHQPSRIKFAHDLTRAMAAERLWRFTPGLAPDPILGDQIGRPLATMLAAATVDADDGVQRLVVRSSPIHKIGSFRGESVDLGELQVVLCSCSAVIDKLAERGQLTLDEENRARTYLERQEERWPGEPAIADGAHLYLDDLSVSYLRTSGVLDKLHAAGLTAYVSEREIAEANALIELESRAEAIEKVIERIRSSLAAGIARNNVQVDKMFTGDEIKAHPNIAVIRLAGLVDVIVCDDRYMNQHRTIDSEGGSAAIWTSLDLLTALRSSKTLTDDTYWRHRTTLRQSGLVLFPSSAEELTAFVGRSQTRDGQMIETGELRAFRENLTLAQMRGWLALPHEAHWLNKLTSDLIQTIRAQWTDAVSDADARARSRWLLACADMRNWAGQITENDGIYMARYGFVASVNSLLMSHVHDLSDDGAARLWDWLEEEVVGALKVEEPATYAWLIEQLRVILCSHLDGGDSNDGN